jgi:hypothetical protein
MQKYFYILLGSDIVAIKNGFRDMGEKLKLWKHKLKAQNSKRRYTCYSEGESGTYPSKV